MPLYTVMSEAVRLDDDAKSQLAAELTALHVEVAGVPADWVHVVFQDHARGMGFTTGRRAPVVALTLVIRTGRSPAYKRDLLSRLWTLVQAATRLPDEQIVLGIQELPASQAMEMGRAMPGIAKAQAGGGSRP